MGDPALLPREYRVRGAGARINAVVKTFVICSRKKKKREKKKGMNDTSK